jgi:hypothetical protein
MLYSSRFNAGLNKYVEGRLKLLSRRQLPTAKNINSETIPNDVCPSDHVPLIAKFVLVKERPTPTRRS